MLYNFCGTWTWEIVKKGNNDQRELMKNKINGCVNLKVRINGEKYAVGSGFYIRDEILMEMPRSELGDKIVDEDPFYIITNFHVVQEMKEKINSVLTKDGKPAYTFSDMKKNGV